MTFEKTFKRGDRVSYALIDGTIGLGRFVRISGSDGFALVEIGDPDGPIAVRFETLHHAPVDVVGPKPAPLPTTCPTCGAALTIDPVARKHTPRGDGHFAKRTVRVAFCSQCEYAKEC